MHERCHNSFKTMGDGKHQNRTFFGLTRKKFGGPLSERAHIIRAIAISRAALLMSCRSDSCRSSSASGWFCTISPTSLVGLPVSRGMALSRAARALSRGCSLRDVHHPPLSPSVYRGEMHGAASLAESRRDGTGAGAPLGRPDEPGLLGGHCVQWRRMLFHGCVAATGCYTPSPPR